MYKLGGERACSLIGITVCTNCRDQGISGEVRSPCVGAVLPLVKSGERLAVWANVTGSTLLAHAQGSSLPTGQGRKRRRYAMRQRGTFWARNSYRRYLCSWRSWL